MRKSWILPAILIFSVCGLLPAGSYQDGLNAYREGRDLEARGFLEKALAEEAGNDGVCLYLGILYQKEGDPAAAEEIMKKGISLQGKYFHELIFNLANLYYTTGKYEQAEEQYTSLAETLNPFRTKALLNRANMSVTNQAYQKALDDYLNYLMEVPDTPKRESIEEMVALLRQYLQDEEQKRLEEEDRLRREEEERRLAAEEEARKLEEETRQREIAEQQRLEEEARQRALMENILNSLSTAGKETESFNAESEKVEEDFEESDLDD